MNILKLIAFFLILSLDACNLVSSKSKDYRVPLTKEIIKGFINLRNISKESTDIIIVNLSVKRDTLVLEIVNTYPNIKEMKFNTDTAIDGHRIIFTGEKIEGYYSKNSLNKFPNDIVKINEEQHRLLLNDASDWLFRFKNEKVIYYSPKEEIDQFVNISVGLHQ